MCAVLPTCYILLVHGYITWVSVFETPCLIYLDILQHNKLLILKKIISIWQISNTNPCSETNKSVCSRNRMYKVVFPHNGLDSTKHWIYAAYINKSSCLQCIIYYKQLEVRTIITIILSSLKINLIGWVIVALSVVDRDFEHRSGPAKDYKIAICGLPAEHAALKGKNQYWWTRNQNNVSDWYDMLLFSISKIIEHI